MNLVNQTPIESYFIGSREILVKREDLCAPFPGPSFSKMRGVVAHIRNRPESLIGVLDTYHSKAGWAVAWACSGLGKRCIDFWPRYKADGDAELPRIQQRHARDLGATPYDLAAGRSALLYHAARKKLTEIGNASGLSTYMMPNALKLPESITENAAEVMRSRDALPKYGTLIISISSGTVASGIIAGFEQAGLLPNYHLILHAGYSRSPAATIAYIESKSGVSLTGFGLSDRPKTWRLVDEGYGYSDTAAGDPAPSPCNEFYDLKAWCWLESYIDKIPDGPIVFWNIGD